jgi:hypothetical protein
MAWPGIHCNSTTYMERHALAKLSANERNVEIKPIEHCASSEQPSPHYVPPHEPLNLQKERSCANAAFMGLNPLIRPAPNPCVGTSIAAGRSPSIFADHPAPLARPPSGPGPGSPTLQRSSRPVWMHSARDTCSRSAKGSSR